MGELVDRDQEHLTWLKVGFYIMAGLNGLCALLSVGYIAMGGFVMSGMPAQSLPGVDQRLVGVFILGAGLAVLVFGLIAAFLTYFAGRSLGARRRRTLCMVVAGLLCLSIPFGTLLGVCTIIVLNRPTVKWLFGRNRLSRHRLYKL